MQKQFLRRDPTKAVPAVMAGSKEFEFDFVRGSVDLQGQHVQQYGAKFSNAQGISIVDESEQMKRELIGHQQAKEAKIAYGSMVQDDQQAIHFGAQVLRSEVAEPRKLLQ
jgi:hypothetical protein